MMTIVLMLISLLANTNSMLDLQPISSSANAVSIFHAIDEDNEPSTANNNELATDDEHIYYMCDECGDIYVDITEDDGVYLDDEAVFICAKHFATATYQSNDEQDEAATYNFNCSIAKFKDDGSTVVIESADGNSWEYYCSSKGKPRKVGDIATVTFSDNGTPNNMTDDRIVSVVFNNNTTNSNDIDNNKLFRYCSILRACNV